VSASSVPFLMKISSVLSVLQMLNILPKRKDSRPEFLT